MTPPKGRASQSTRRKHRSDAPVVQTGQGGDRTDPGAPHTLADAPSSTPAPALAKPVLRIAFCEHDAARYAVTHWHYSRSLPTPPIVKVGVWEDGRFIGVVLFSRGATNNLGKPYGLGTTEVCELTRIALAPHRTPVSRIESIARKFLVKHCPGLRLIISFADTAQNHHGGIYQAGGWLYIGMTAPTPKFIDRNGREWHSRQVSTTGTVRQYGVERRVPKTDECRRIMTPGKHRYAMPLDDAMRRQLAPLVKPYPKRAPAALPAPTTSDDESRQ